MKTTLAALGLSAVMASAAAAQETQLQAITPEGERLEAVEPQATHITATEAEYNADNCVIDLFQDVIDSLADLKEEVDADGISVTGMVLTYTQDQLDGFVADCEQQTGTQAVITPGLMHYSDGFTTIEIEP